MTSLKDVTITATLAKGHYPLSFVSKFYREMTNDIFQNFDKLSKNFNQELIDNIIAGKQDWQFVRYDHKKKKWITRPIFYVKYRWSKKYEKLGIKQAIPLFGSFFPITDDLRSWIKESKYASQLANFC